MGFKLSTPSQCIIGGGIRYEVLLPGAVMWNVAPFKQKHTNKNNARWWFQSSWNTLVKTGGGLPKWRDLHKDRSTRWIWTQHLNPRTSNRKHVKTRCNTDPEDIQMAQSQLIQGFFFPQHLPTDTNRSVHNYRHTLIENVALVCLGPVIALPTGGPLQHLLFCNTWLQLLFKLQYDWVTVPATWPVLQISLHI